MISSVNFDTDIKFCTVKVEYIISYRFLSESSISGFIIFEDTMSDETFCFRHRFTIDLREGFEFVIVGDRIFLHHSMVNIKSVYLLIMKSPWSIDHPPLRKGVYMRLIMTRRYTTTE